VEVQKKRYDDAAEPPADVRDDLAAAYLRLGEVAVQAGRLPRAEQAFRDHLHIREKSPRGDANAVVWQSDLAAGYERLSQVERRLGEPAEALRLARRAVAARQETLTPHSPLDEFLIDDQAADLAAAYDTLGYARLEAGDVRAAAEAFTFAQGIHASLVDKDPQEPQWRLGEARDLEGLGLAAMRAEDYTTAAGWLRRSLAKMLRLQTDGVEMTTPEDRDRISRLRADILFCEHSKEALGDLAGLLKRPRAEAVALVTRRAEVQCLRGADKDAAATVEALRNLAPNDGRNLYDTARCYGLMANAVQGGRPMEELNSDERGRFAEYLLKGLGALNQAVGHGFNDDALLRSDADIDALRRADGYETLLDTVDQRRVAAPK
jgi:hypothetical protein